MVCCTFCTKMNYIRCLKFFWDWDTIETDVLTSIFSSSFFWSISVIRRWSIDGDGRTLSEPASSFLMQDWQERRKKYTNSPHASWNSKQFSLETWDDSLVKLQSNKLSSYTYELQMMTSCAFDMKESQTTPSTASSHSLTFSLSVLLLSVSDSAPEEEGLWPPATLVIHGGRMPGCHWLLVLSMLCWGISKSQEKGGS